MSGELAAAYALVDTVERLKKDRDGWRHAAERLHAALELMPVKPGTSDEVDEAIDRAIDAYNAVAPR